MVRKIQNLRCQELIQVKISLGSFTKVRTGTIDTEMICTEMMVVETTEAGEISQEYTIKNENRTLKMLTIKK